MLKSGVSRLCRVRGLVSTLPLNASFVPTKRTLGSANFRQSSGCIEIKFCSSYPHSFAGARFSISLRARSRRIRYKGLPSKFARDRSGQVARKPSFSFASCSPIVDSREKFGVGSLIRGTFSCYAPMGASVRGRLEDFEVLTKSRLDTGHVISKFFLHRCSTLWIYILDRRVSDSRHANVTLVIL